MRGAFLEFYVVCLVIAGLPLTAQDNLVLESKISLGEDIFLTGSVELISDSTLIVTANGGLMSTRPEAWLVPVVADDHIISYRYRHDHENVLYSTFNQLTHVGYILLQSISFSATVRDTIAAIDSCVCYVESEHGLVIIHGFRGKKYMMWELTPDGFTEIFALSHQPTDLQILDRSTIMASFYNKIIMISKETGASVFFEAPDDHDVLGFLLTPGKKFYMTSDAGLFQLSGGQLIPEIPNIKGQMEWQDGRIIVLDPASGSLAILSEKN